MNLLLPRPPTALTDSNAVAKRILQLVLLVLLTLLPLVTQAGRLDAAQLDDDPRGPVACIATAPIVSVAGVEAGDATSDANIVATDHTWKASWIQPAPCSGGGDQLRTTVTLAHAPRHVTAWVTANGPYKLFVNGRLVARGPVNHGEDYPASNKKRDGQVPIDTGLWFYDACDLTPFFSTGDNVIAIEIHGAHGALFEADVTQADTTTMQVVSDAHWKGTPLACWDGWHYDAKHDTRGWRSVGFDDTAWPACAVVANGHPQLVQSEIPARMEVEYPIAHIVNDPGIDVPAKAFGPAAGIVMTHDGSFTIALDRLVSAYVGIRVSGGAGATLRIHGSEKAGGSSTRSLEISLDGASHAIETPFYDSFSVVRVEATHVTAPITVEQVRIIFTSFPVHYRGSFSCDDEHLNQLWTACRWNMQLCMQDYHIDSPNHQEPLDGAGDYLIHDGVTRYAFGETRLARQDLRKIGHMLDRSRYQLFHTSYALYWLHTLIEFYENTGDRELVTELAPTVHGLLARFMSYRGANGLISEAPDYMFMDWVGIAGFSGHHPPAVIGQGYMSALFYQALADASIVAQLSGHPEQVEPYEVARRQLSIACERELWNADKQRYRDGKPFQSHVPENDWLPADRAIETFTAQVSSLAVLTGLAPAERWAPLMDLVMQDRPLNCQPYFMHFVFGALAKAHRFDVYGTAQLRRWTVDRATGTTRETFNDGDYSHAWQCTPLIQMSQRVLGISPAAPAWSSVLIAPTLCDLHQAHGAVPTPIGPVAVAWQRDQGGWRCTVSTPGTATAVMAVPATRFSSPVISLDNIVVWREDAAVAGSSARANADRVMLQLTAGRHTVRIDGQWLALASAVAVTRTTITQERPAQMVIATACADSPRAFDADVAGSLVQIGNQACSAATESGAVHAGGSTDANPIRNGTTLNRDGGDSTEDDGATYRGYGSGSQLVFQLDLQTHPHGYTLTRIVTVAGHTDRRASQHYDISIALSSDPGTFLPFAAAAVASLGGASEIRLNPTTAGVLVGTNGLHATGVAAIRFTFADGSNVDSGDGFDVYREIAIMGAPTTP